MTSAAIADVKVAFAKKISMIASAIAAIADVKVAFAKKKSMIANPIPAIPKS
ncbi:hypothetical protein H6G35_19655 [Aulosira sp. FACHB-113]|uniref:hypothetical protein n=1 Tax=Tolypothrix tenuis TaxID=457083 RepID=UPI00168932EC|nr:hypothetical protein [Aulosira sp. FACHB-113]